MSLSFETGSVPEPPVSDEAFFHSLLDYGIWLRAIAARLHLSTIQSDAQLIERIAALGQMAQLFGQAIEDSVSLLITWSVWAPHRELRIADILARMTLRFSQPKKDPPAGYVHQVQCAFADSGGRVNIYPRRYLRELIDCPDQHLPARFGVPWKQHPNSRLAPTQQQRNAWPHLPRVFRGIVTPFTDDKGALVAASYNKIKHGPQIMVERPIHAALSRGLEVPKEFRSLLEKHALRVLLDGARTQDTAEERESGIRVAPFLVDEPAVAEEWYHKHVIGSASMLYQLATIIFNASFPDLPARSHSTDSSVIKQLISESNAYLMRQGARPEF